MLALSTLVVLVRVNPKSHALLFAHTFLCQHLHHLCRCNALFALTSAVASTATAVADCAWYISLCIKKKRINIHFVQIIQSFVLVLNHVLLFASYIYNFHVIRTLHSYISWKEILKNSIVTGRKFSFIFLTQLNWSHLSHLIMTPPLIMRSPASSFSPVQFNSVGGHWWSRHRNRYGHNRNSWRSETAGNVKIGCSRGGGKVRRLNGKINIIF